MMLDGEAVEIVGVMPAGVDFPRGAEFWVPVVPALASGTPPDSAMLDTLGVFYVVGRVRPGLDMDAVRAEVDAHRSPPRCRESRAVEVGHHNGRDAVRRLRLWPGAPGIAGAVGSCRACCC